jgi:hypothetical protein
MIATMEDDKKPRKRVKTTGRRGVRTPLTLTVESAGETEASAQAAFDNMTQILLRVYYRVLRECPEKLRSCRKVGVSQMLPKSC